MFYILGKSHLLDDVIENIEFKGDYYRTKTMNYYIGETHPLYAILRQSRSA